MSGPQLAPLRLVRRRCPAPGRSSSRSGRWQSAASCSASPLSAAPDYGRAQRSTAAAEKSAGDGRLWWFKKITDVERFESSSRNGGRTRWVASRLPQGDLTPLADLAEDPGVNRRHWQAATNIALSGARATRDA